MKNFILIKKILFFVFLSASLMSGCSYDKSVSGNMLSPSDTLLLIQDVFNDKQLIEEVVKDFGDQRLKLADELAVSLKKQLTFNRKPIQIVAFPDDVYSIHFNYPGKLYVSISEIKFRNKDSASVELIFHAGNAIDIFDLKKINNQWIIYRRQRGKF